MSKAEVLGDLHGEAEVFVYIPQVVQYIPALGKYVKQAINLSSPESLGVLMQVSGCIWAWVAIY